MGRHTKTIATIAGLWVVIMVVTASMVWQYTILGEVTLWTVGVLVCSAGVFMPLMQIATEPREIKRNQEPEIVR